MTFPGVTALDRLSLSLECGASIGLVGPNGAGKTTFLSLLCGFLRAASGSLRVLGEPPGSPGLNSRIGILPQDIPLLKGIPVGAQLALFARLHSFTARASRREGDRVLAMLDIAGLGGQFPETLSFGQRKRVTLAQALLGRPELLLLDEPTSGLDPLAAAQVRGLIQGMRRDHSLIVSSHNLDEIRDLCDEIVIIDRGRLVRHCAITDLVERDSYLSFLLEQPAGEPLRDALSRVAGVLQVEPAGQDPRRLAIRCQSGDADQLQFKVLEVLKENGARVIEFSRGTVFAERVVELVRRRDDGMSC